MAIKVSGTTVIDDSRGLTNIATVDATTAAAISAAGVGGGGEHDFVASGAIETGDIVTLNADGTVSVVEQTNRGSTAGPTLLADSGHVTATFDSSNNKVVVAYNKYTSPRTGNIVVGTLTENSIAFGTPVVFHSGEVQRLDSVFDSVNNKVVIVFTDVDDSSSKQAVVATVSGNTVSVGSPVTFSTHYYDLKIAFDSNSGKVVVATGVTGNYPACIVGTVSGSSISFGTAVVVESVASGPKAITFDTINNKIFFTYSGKAVVGTVSGTSISFGTPVAYSSNASFGYSDAVFDPVSGKIAFMYQEGSSGPMRIQVATISGTSVSFGTAVDVVADNKLWVRGTFDSTNNKFCFVYDDSGDNNILFISGSISGNTVILDPQITLHNSHAQNATMGLTFDPTINRVFFVGSIFASSYLINTTAFTNAASYIGIAAENIADTATGAVTIDGGVNERTVDSYDLANASYDSVSLGGFDGSETPYQMSFKPDGTKMFILGFSLFYLKEYNLSTAWDISTASFVQEVNLSSDEPTPFGLFIKPDGTKVYIVGGDFDRVNEYDLSTAWDISTISYVQNFSVSSQMTNPNGLSFKPDGTKVFVSDVSSSRIYEYDLSTAWDISTASYNQNFSVGETLRNLFFNPDGLSVFVAADGPNTIIEYSLSTAWDVSTMSLVRSFSVATQDTSPYGVFFGNRGVKMYVSGGSTRTVYQYTTGTFGGYTINASQFVADDGSLTTTNNGRKIGKAISATEIIVDSALTGDETNEYLGSLV